MTEGIEGTLCAAFLEGFLLFVQHSEGSLTRGVSVPVSQSRFALSTSLYLFIFLSIDVCVPLTFLQKNILHKKKDGIIF